MKLKDGCTITETADGGVVLDARVGTYYQVNRAGLSLLLAIASGQTEAQVIEGVRLRYPELADVAAADARGLIGQFRGEGLVVDE